MVLEVIIQRGVLIFSRQVRLEGRVGETKAKSNIELDSNNYGRLNDLIECGLCGSKLRKVEQSGAKWNEVGQS